MRARRGAAVLALAVAAGLLSAAPTPTSYAVLPGEQAPRTWRVGPDRALTLPSQAAAVARDGDTVLIDPGTYSGDVATWTQDDLTLAGDGGRAHLRADGNAAQGKAIWVIQGDNTTVDRVELSGATVPDRNGAGIRLEGTGLTVQRSWFHDNENGILTGADPESNVFVLRSRFFRNGAGDGYSHNLYVGAVESLTVAGCWLSEADTGHELKSRARSNTIVANRISDGSAGSSYSIDLPNGGRALVGGNVVVQGRRSENSTLVSYGAEGLSGSSGYLWVVNNTFVNRRASGTFVSLADGSRAHLRNNLLVGRGDLVDGPVVDARANRRVGLGGFVAPHRDDFRLVPGSPAVDRGTFVPSRWRARQQYDHPARHERRPVVGRTDLGAHELR